MTIEWIRVVRQLAGLLTLILAVAPDLGAQEDQVSEGTRVRVSTDARSIYVGELVSVTQDSIALNTAEKPPPTIEHFAITAIERLQVSDGFERTGDWVQGAAIGAGVGFVIGGAFALFAPRGERPASDSGDGERIALVVGATVVGAGAGALIGSGPKKERWRDILVGSLQVGVSTTGVSLAIAVRI